MALVNRKPAYIGSSEAKIYVWAGLDRNPGFTAYLFGQRVSDVHAVQNKALYDNPLPASELDFLQSGALARSATAKPIRCFRDRVWLAYDTLCAITRFSNPHIGIGFEVDPLPIFSGARAAVIVAHLYLEHTKGMWHADKEVASWCQRFSWAMTTLGAEESRMPADGTAGLMGKLLTAANAGMYSAMKSKAKKDIEPAVPRHLVMEARRISSRTPNLARLNKLKDKAPIERFAWESHPLVEAGFSVWWMAGVTVLKHDEEVFLLDGDAREAARRQVVSFFNIIQYKHMDVAHRSKDKGAKPSHTDFAELLLKVSKDAAEYSRRGESYTKIAKALIQASVARLQRYKAEGAEADDVWDTISSENEQAILQAAEERYADVGAIFEKTLAWELSDALEYLRCGNVLQSDDSDPLLMSRRIKAAAESRRAVSQKSKEEAHAFYKTLDLCNFMVNHGEILNTGGAELDKEA